MAVPGSRSASSSLWSPASPLVDFCSPDEPVDDDQSTGHVIIATG
jgi:hypothetical protein